MICIIQPQWRLMCLFLCLEKVISLICKNAQYVFNYSTQSFVWTSSRRTFQHSSWARSNTPLQHGAPARRFNMPLQHGASTCRSSTPAPARRSNTAAPACPPTFPFCFFFKLTFILEYQSLFTWIWRPSTPQKKDKSQQSSKTPFWFSSFSLSNSPQTHFRTTTPPRSCSTLGKLETTSISGNNIFISPKLSSISHHSKTINSTPFGSWYVRIFQRHFRDIDLSDWNFEFFGCLSFGH